MSLLPGLYQHYKGDSYQVLHLATHSETREQLVIYRCLYDDFSLWARPLAMFLENVQVSGELIPRFEFVRPMSAQEIAELPPLPWESQ